MGGQPQYLEQIVENYGEGDRAAEARFLLEHHPQSTRQRTQLVNCR
ncbi:MAG: hypothetical protein HC878_01670 [Leptolyngbyaceae cyanobacterium SL_5_14]|nr:hypothetical protein [Leptolyngbyaceae cyanobacterium SL_5_14]